MQKILSGHGVLKEGRRLIGGVDFVIIRRKYMNVPKTIGHLRGEPDVLLDAFTSGTIRLRPDAGGQGWKIVVTSCNFDKATISVIHNTLR